MALSVLPKSKIVSIESGRERFLAKRDALIEQHLDLARSIAEQIARSLPSHFELDDLIATGNLGLIEAATRYRPRQHNGTPFSAYARYVIRGKILDSVRRRHYTEATRPGLGTLEPAITPVIEISIDRKRTRERVKDAVAYLPPRDQTVLSLYYGEERNLEQVGEAIGLSRASAVKIHSGALAKLRTRIRK